MAATTGGLSQGVARQRLHVHASMCCSRGWVPRPWRCCPWLNNGYKFFVFHVLVNSSPVVLASRSPVHGLPLDERRSVHSRRFVSLFARAVCTRSLDSPSSSLLTGGMFLKPRRKEKYAQSIVLCLCARCTLRNWTLFPRVPRVLQSLVVVVWVLAFGQTQPVFCVTPSVGVAR